MHYVGTMKTFLLILLAFSATLITSCASNRIANPNAKQTPGTLPINGVLLVDKTEVSNFNWLEYLHWQKRVFGNTSEEYLSALPDSNVLSSAKCKLAYPEDHFEMVQYRNLPVVGITQDQAHAYSQWRSDRVFEYLLIKEKKIEHNANQTAQNYFSISNYFSGIYYDHQDTNGVVSGAPITPNFDQKYPEYSLPSADQRLMILDYVDSTDFVFHSKRRKAYEKWRKSNLPFHMAISTCAKTVGTVMNDEPLRSTQTDLDSKGKFNLLYDTRGNVAEWGDAPNVTYGGGWPHNVEYILSKDTVKVTESNAWTGFRNVCAWKKWGE